MRKPFFAGNWKMNTDAASGPALAAALAASHGQRTEVDLLVCPPFPYLASVRQALAGSKIALGGQNCWHEAKGAFTGEVSPAMLRDCGCGWVILGHSERRHILGETDELLKKKALAALSAGLRPVFCVGETLAQRQADQTEAVAHAQLQGGLGSLSAEQFGQVVLAYEPVWAIGTGVNASPEQAESVHQFLRKRVEGAWGAAAAQRVRILYGGSVNPGNAAALLAQPNLDGFLIGGASLKASDFGAVIDSGAKAAAART